MAFASAAACARSADEPYTDDPSVNAAPAADKDAGVTQYPSYDSGVRPEETGSGADAAAAADTSTPKDVSVPDVNLDGPPPPPPPPPADGGGNPAVCDVSNPVGAAYYFYEFTKASNAPSCPCGPTECCYTYIVVQVCLNRGF